MLQRMADPSNAAAKRGVRCPLELGSTSTATPAKPTATPSHPSTPGLRLHLITRPIRVIQSGTVAIISAAIPEWTLSSARVTRPLPPKRRKRPITPALTASLLLVFSQRGGQLHQRPR